MSRVCVVGGGPAGAATARRLALEELEVTLVERAAFPRPRIGESLPPGVLPLLDALGVRDRVETANFLRPASSIVRWQGPVSHHHIDGEPGFQVDRGRFDALLLSAAESAGVKVIQPGVAGPPRRVVDGWRIPIVTGTSRRWLAADYLVDASAGHWLRRRRRRLSPPTLALYAYWPRSFTDSASRIDVGSDCWYWGAPIPGGRFAAAVFVDPQTCCGREIATEYRRRVTGSSLLRPCLQGEPLTAVRGCDASSYAAKPIGPGWIRVGESALALDPLSSQGDTSALKSGLQAAAVIATLLESGGADPAASEFYLSRHREAVDRHRRFAAGYYRQRATVGRFFAARANAREARSQPLSPGPPPADRPMRLADDAVLVEVPQLRNGRVVRRRALSHPALERPIAYLADTPIANLLEAAAQGLDSSQLLESWSRHVEPARARGVLHWFWSRRILIAPPNGSRPPICAGEESQAGGSSPVARV